MSPAHPLPADATVDQLEADRIARKASRRSASFTYWRERFSELHENVLYVRDPSEGNTPFVKLLRAATGRCMVSLSDISKTANPSGTAATLFRDLLAYSAEAQSYQHAKNPRQISRGIRYAREIYDAIRRSAYCRKNRQEFSIPFSELLSLYFQEGALAITPPPDSYLHAPLIATTSQADVCRTHRMHLIDRSARRPGFLLVYQYDGQSMLDTASSRALQSVWRNLAAVGGLDCIVAPPLRENDELVTVMDLAVRVILGSYAEDLAEAELGVAYWLLIGLAMAELDYRKVPLRLSDLRSLMEAGLSDLMSSHRTSKVEHNGQEFCCLVGDPSPDSDGVPLNDTYFCLRVQARWYAGCCAPYTLLAWRDRQEPYISMSRMPPFMSYLRFHSGDSDFLSMLVKGLTKLPSLRSKLTTEQTKNLSDLLRHKAELEKEEGQDLWRHHGLIAACERAGACPGGVYASPSPNATELRRTNADLALEVIKIIRDKQLLGDIDKALRQRTPDELVGAGLFRRTTRVENTIAFEQRRVVYAKMVAEAGLPELDDVSQPVAPTGLSVSPSP